MLTYLHNFAMLLKHRRLLILVLFPSAKEKAHEAWCHQEPIRLMGSWCHTLNSPVAWGAFATASASIGNAMLMRPNKAGTSVYVSWYLPGLYGCARAFWDGHTAGLVSCVTLCLVSLFFHPYFKWNFIHDLIAKENPLVLTVPAHQVILKLFLYKL